MESVCARAQNERVDATTFGSAELLHNFRVSRRELFRALAAFVAVGVPGRISAVGDVSAIDSPTPVNFRVPPGACDCHVHVFCDPRRFPLSADRTYTPPPAPVEALRGLLRGLGMDRVVIVSPAIYGVNNDCTLDAIRQLGSQARGIALVKPQSTDSELEMLRRGGICGLRLNFETFGVTDPQVAIQQFQSASRQAAEQGWHIQINTRLSVVEALEDEIQIGPVTVVFDHFAQARAALGVEQPGFAALVRLLSTGRVYVKISAAYHISTQPPDYLEVAPLARALIEANPQRILWGSDWPHPDAAKRPGRSPTDVRPPLPVDDNRMLNLLAVWAPDPAEREAILVENPTRLYGFESSR
jgi:predicted TIM-barrel fold metal-dependent hydrolase